MTTNELDRQPDRIVLWILAAALLCGAFLRLRGLGGPSLWLDELVTLWAASAPSFSDVLARCSSCMATPPLPFLVHHAFLSVLGPGEWALRLPAALAGIAAIPVVFFAALRAFGKDAAAVSALLLAIHPLHLSVSMDARPYALAVLLAAGSVWAFAEAMRSGRSAALSAWALCSAALLYAQFVFLPLLAAQAAAYVLFLWRNPLKRLTAPRMAAAFGVVVVLSLPLAPQIRSVAARSQTLAWPVQLEFLSGLTELFAPAALIAAGLVALVVSLLHRREADLRPAGQGLETAAAEGPDVLVVSICCVLPMLALAGLSQLSGMAPLALPRYASAYLVPAVLLLGWALTRPRRRVDRAILSGSFLAMILLTHIVPTLTAGRSFNANLSSQDWRGACRRLAAGWRDGDIVLLRSGLVESNGLFNGSFGDSCRGYLASPMPDLYLGRSIDPVMLPVQFGATPLPPSYDDRIGRKLAGHDRIWLVLLAPPESTAYLRSVLAYVDTSTNRRFTMVQSEIFGQVMVALISPER